MIRPGGGGWDVPRSLASGSHDVTAVEINPIIGTEIMRKNDFRNTATGLYLRPDVHINIEDGRSFVRRSQEKYQVIQATLVDTWASTAAGAFALSENNLYTVEAFRDYLSHLTDDGLLTFTRWGFEPPRESLRGWCRWRSRRWGNWVNTTCGAACSRGTRNGHPSGPDGLGRPGYGDHFAEGAVGCGCGKGACGVYRGPGGFGCCLRSQAMGPRMNSGGCYWRRTTRNTNGIISSTLHR